MGVLSVVVGSGDDDGERDMLRDTLLLCDTPAGSADADTDADTDTDSAGKLGADRADAVGAGERDADGGTDADALWLAFGGADVAARREPDGDAVARREGDADATAR